MVSYPITKEMILKAIMVLILVVVEDGLVHTIKLAACGRKFAVLILVVVEDGLVPLKNAVKSVFDKVS